MKSGNYERSSLGVVFACAALGGWAIACSSGGGNVSGATGAADAGREASTTPALATIKLIQNPWDASRLDAVIAQILLTEQMGMTVQVTEVDSIKQWDQLASGDQHASFEVWPSGHGADVAKYVDTGKVENGGPLGPVGKISWYVPTYLLSTKPELASFSAYKDSANTAPFATPETLNKGRFLAGDPTWTQYDADIIKNLGLNLQVVVAKTEQAELAELDSVYNKRGAILMYLWSPHSALAKYDLTAVQLPPHTDTCYASIPDGGVSCDYPADHLFKILWPGLKNASPRAYQFLKNLSLSDKDQINLLAAVNNQGQTVAQAARVWVDANKPVWQAWIPQ